MTTRRLVKKIAKIFNELRTAPSAIELYGAAGVHLTAEDEEHTTSGSANIFSFAIAPIVFLSSAQFDVLLIAKLTRLHSNVQKGQCMGRRKRKA